MGVHGFFSKNIYYQEIPYAGVRKILTVFTGWDV
jgi:hypothetical protein